MIHGGGTWLYSFRVIALDMPGHGHTEPTKPAARCDFETSDGVLREFLDPKRIRQVSLVGHSWGGWALHFAQRHPERIRKLILLASGGRLVLSWTAAAACWPETGPGRATVTLRDDPRHLEREGRVADPGGENTGFASSSGVFGSWVSSTFTTASGGVSAFFPKDGSNSRPGLHRPGGAESGGLVAFGPRGLVGFGAQIWLDDPIPAVLAHRAFSGIGHRGQYVTVVSSQDLVVVRTGLDPEEGDVLRRQDRFFADLIEAP